MNTLTQALLNAYNGDFLETLYPTLPILSGQVIPLSNYGKSMYGTPITWASEQLVANFIPVQNAPYVVGNYGTVNFAGEQPLRMNPIHIEACKVSFNDVRFRQELEQFGQEGVNRLYNDQIAAKVRAWDEKCNGLIIYGDATLGIPGILNGSDIPQINSLVNMTAAAPDLVLAELLRLVSIIPNSSRNVFMPTKLAIPQTLHTLLNTRTLTLNDSRSILSVFQERLATLAPFAQMGMSWEVTAVNAYDNDKIGTILPADPQLIGAAVWDLEEFYAPDSSESYNAQPSGLASAHRGGCAGVIAKRPESGLIIRFLY